MKAKLLKEHTIIHSGNIEYQVLKESITKDSNNNVYKAVGILKNVPISKYTKNANGRIYTKKLWTIVESKYPDRIEGSLALADHPPDDNPEGSVKDCCGVWHNFKVGDDCVRADLYLIGDIGKHILDIVKAGGKIGISTVGYGTYDEEGYVDPDSYELLRVGDVVSVPSQGTYVERDNIYEEENNFDRNNATINTNNKFMEKTSMNEKYFSNFIKNQSRVLVREALNRLEKDNVSLLLESKSALLDLIPSIPEDLKEERKQVEEVLDKVNDKINKLLDEKTKSSGSTEKVILEDYKKGFDTLLENYKVRIRKLEEKLKESLEDREKLVSTLNELLLEREEIEKKYAKFLEEKSKEIKNNSTANKPLTLEEAFSFIRSAPISESLFYVEKYIEELKKVEKYLPEHLAKKAKNILKEEKVIKKDNEKLKKAVSLILDLKESLANLYELNQVLRFPKKMFILVENINFSELKDSVSRLFEGDDKNSFTYQAKNGGKYLTFEKDGSRVIGTFYNKNNKVLDRIVLSSKEAINSFKDKIEQFLNLGIEPNSGEKAKNPSYFQEKKEQDKNKKKEKVLREDFGDDPYIFLPSEKGDKHPNSDKKSKLRNNEVLWTDSEEQQISIDPAMEFRIRNKGVYKLAEASDIYIPNPVTSTFKKEDPEKMKKEKIRELYEEYLKEYPQLDLFENYILSSESLLEATKRIQNFVKKIQGDPLINLKESTKFNISKNYEDDWLIGI